MANITDEDLSHPPYCNEVSEAIGEDDEDAKEPNALTLRVWWFGIKRTLQHRNAVFFVLSMLMFGAASNVWFTLNGLWLREIMNVC